MVFHNIGNCRSIWFPPMETFKKHRSAPSDFTVCDGQYELDDYCYFQYDDIVIKNKFDKIAAFSSFYTNDEVYDRVGREMCVVIDICAGMSGSEAVVKSYYSVMATQTKPGGQLNESLVQRTNIDWCFPSVNQCE